jgi:hypothetical protein
MSMENYQMTSSSVSSKEDLADFIDALKDDFIKNSVEWENPTIDRFLDAMAEWVRSMDDYCRNTGRPPVEHPTWSVFADILSAAKIYE